MTKFLEGLKKGDRVTIGKALSLIESTLESDRQSARKLIREILPYSGKSLRLGITGIPGSGKSTFIEAFGKLLVEKGKKVAVLSIDPSSQITGGSILGDKTRMETLSKSSSVFIRPSASGNMLGGIARNTRESILVLEAAGYDIILIETVGVGQSEVAVSELVDFLVLVLIAGAGDELQGIKKGIMEKANLILVNKADGNNIDQAKKTTNSLKNAISILFSNLGEWAPDALAVSSLKGNGIEETWKSILDTTSKMNESGFIEKTRLAQNSRWFETELMNQIHMLF